MHRGILLGVALATLSCVPAGASTTSMSYSATTSAAGVVLPVSTISVRDSAVSANKRDGSRTTAITVSGSNLPGTESVVAAVWRSTVRAGRAGAAVSVAVDGDHMPLPGGTTSDVTVERQVRGGWVTCDPDVIMAGRAVGLVGGGTLDQFTVHCRGVRNGSSVPVRVTIFVTYDEPAATIDDTISVTAITV
jgi:hypothetical protein